MEIYNLSITARLDGFASLAMTNRWRRHEILLSREHFGQSSERGKLIVEQLELAIKDLEETQGEEEAKAEIATPVAAKEKRKRTPRGPRKLRIT